MNGNRARVYIETPKNMRFKPSGNTKIGYVFFNYTSLRMSAQRGRLAMHLARCFSWYSLAASALAPVPS